MDFTSGEMGPSKMHYGFVTADELDFAVKGQQTVQTPRVNERLVERYLMVCEKHPQWTFGQVASSLRVDASTVRQLEQTTNHRLRSVKHDEKRA